MSATDTGFNIPFIGQDKPTFEIPLDSNGKKDGRETDVDCGGPDTAKKCGVLKTCKETSDCAALGDSPIPCLEIDGKKKCGDPPNGSERGCAEILKKSLAGAPQPAEGLSRGMVF